MEPKEEFSHLCARLVQIISISPDCLFYILITAHLSDHQSTLKDFGVLSKQGATVKMPALRWTGVPLCSMSSTSAIFEQEVYKYFYIEQYNLV